MVGFVLENGEVGVIYNLFHKFFSSFFGCETGHKVWITRLLNPCVWLGSFVLQPINKMFGTYYYDPEMSKMDYDYQLVSFEESLKRVAESLRK